MSERIEFFIYGESAEPNEVVFTINEDVIYVTCRSFV